MKTSEEIRKNVFDLLEMKDLMESVKEEIEKIESTIKAEMTERGITELLVDEHKITYSEVISQRFNSTAFKKDFLDIYKEYTKPVTTMRFSIK